MRIISGKYKRKILASPDGTHITRPTSDRVKENMFNILHTHISFDDSVVLDLFSGSGALGIEGLSRGARKCIFVEENKQAIDCLKKNISSLSDSSLTCTILQENVQSFLKTKNVRFKKTINLIIADPPYHLDWYTDAIDQITNSEFCSPGCLFLAELPRNKSIGPATTDNWTQLTQRHYGKTKIELWKFLDD